MKEDFLSKLGYTNRGKRPLLTTLLKVGVVPLQDAAVEAYKASKTEALNSTLRQYPKHKLGIALIWAMIAGIWAIESWLWYMQGWGPLATTGVYFNLGLFFIPIVTGLTIWLVGTLQFPSYPWVGHVRQSYSWEATEYNHFTGYVPTAVTLILKDVFTHHRCTAHVIHLELGDNRQDLARADKSQRPIPSLFLGDPFLHVSLNDESYYIAVWDEAEFTNV